MPDGWEYVVITYSLTAVTLGAWFWTIDRKLRRLRRKERLGE